MTQSSVLIVGAGIVGLASAYRLAELLPDAKITVIDKESTVAAHQTGRNSGVIHSGIYYKPGSLKAKTCTLGKQALEQFCSEHGIAFELCGKVIVATNPTELPALEMLHKSGQENGVECKLIDETELKEREPQVRGIKALYVPKAGIVDYIGVCKQLVSLLEARGHQVLLDTSFQSAREGQGEVTVETSRGSHTVQCLVNCAGLHSDRVARASGVQPKAKIVPFRGEYYKLKSDAPTLCNHLIYPVPDTRFPFLGVHFTRMIDGSTECGPNAVLAFAREGYTKATIKPADLIESVLYPGFIKLAATHWKMGLGEISRSFSKHRFVKALQRLVPAVRTEHLEAAPAGVRAQALGPDGKLLDDFVIEASGRMVHVVNAPSPAATAALQIGAVIAETVAERLET